MPFPARLMEYHVHERKLEKWDFTMRIFGMGIPELLIILAIVCVLFGPVLFKKLHKQAKATGQAAKKGLENGAKAAGKDIDLDNIDKGTVLDKIEGFQNKVDKMFDDDDADEGDGAKDQTAGSGAPVDSEASEKKTDASAS